jgi:hypothetical protein
MPVEALAQLGFLKVTVPVSAGWQFAAENKRTARPIRNA